MQDLQIKKILIRDNIDFKRLNLKHQEYERKLQELHSGSIKTEKVWREAQNLKKKKLKLKDLMQKYILEYRKQVIH